MPTGDRVEQTSLPRGSMASRHSQVTSTAGWSYPDLSAQEPTQLADRGTSLRAPTSPSGADAPSRLAQRAGNPDNDQDPFATPTQSNPLVPDEDPDMPAHRSTYSNIDDGRPYQGGAFSSSQWLEKQQASNRRSKIIVVGSILTLLALVAVGVVVGILVTRDHSHKSSSSGSDSSASDGNSTDGYAVGPYGIVKQTNPNDPSTFIKDPRLIKSFYGMAYTPAKSQLPYCGNSLAAVIEDIQLMSQLTDRLRLYGADCNQSALVLEAIKQTKVNMTVWLANYIVATNSTPYERQRDEIMDALKTYGTDQVGGVTVGNEFILDYLGANGGGDDPNSAVGDEGAAILISNLTDTKNVLKEAGYALPVGTSDAGAYFNTKVMENIDFGLSNIHPWFANQSIQQAAGWTYEFFQYENIEPAAKLTNKPDMWIGETGWPTNSTNESNMSNGPSTAAQDNLQIYLDTFVCGSNTNGTKYFYFEFADENWQRIEFGGVEGYWGLFHYNRTLKSITIPKC